TSTTYLLHMIISSYPITPPLLLHSYPTRRSSDLTTTAASGLRPAMRHLMSKNFSAPRSAPNPASVSTTSHSVSASRGSAPTSGRSEEHTSELQSLRHLVCRLLLEKKKNITQHNTQ